MPTGTSLSKGEKMCAESIACWSAHKHGLFPEMSNEFVQLRVNVMFSSPY